MPEIRYTLLCDILEKRLLAGEYTGRLPGVHRLAAEFSTSPVTMSKALKRLERRGYISIVNRQGAFVTLRANDRPRRRLIGWINHLGTVKPRQEIFEETQRLCADHGYRVVMLGAASVEIFRDEEFLRAINVDGYLFSAGALDPVIAHNLRINGIPFVSVNQIDDPTTVNLVEHDHQRDHALVYQHLYDLGHRRIGEIILANPVEFWNAQFEKFYREFMKKHNIYNTNYYVGYTERAGDLQRRYGDGRESLFLEKYLTRLLSLPEPPTALVVEGLTRAEQLCQLLEKHGRKVPDEISVAAIDNGNESKPCESRFTRLFLDSYQRQREATRMLLEILDNPTSPTRSKWIPIRLIPGKTTAPPPTAAD